MAQSITTPLQLTAVAGLLQNLGINSLPTALTTAIQNYNATTVITNWLNAVSWYKAQSFYTETTFDSLLSIGSTVCPALGNSIPAAPIGTFSSLITDYITGNPNPDGSTFDPSGLSNFIEQLGSAELGDGSAAKFTQGFLAVNGYFSTVNKYITSAVNANEYLGPTFTNMDALISADIYNFSDSYSLLGADIANQGLLVNTKNLDLYGTPAGLLQQISNVARLQGSTLPNIQSALYTAGLTNSDIANLVNNNRASLFNPNGLTQNEFDRLQKQAYVGFGLTTAADLQQIMTLLDITTPNVSTVEDLLDPIVMFPLSYDTLKTISPLGAIPIFASNGSVNSDIAPVVNAYLPAASGCDELGKIIPQANATANKAIQVALQNIPAIENSTWPQIAAALNGFAPNQAETATQWDVTKSYLPNAYVTLPTEPPTYYQSQQSVPAGIDINNTSYWAPYTPGSLVTLDGLPLLQAQTTPVDSSVISYFANTVATGSGKYGTITFYDVLGTSVDYNNLASQLNTATTAINALQTAGSLATLNTAYTNIVLAGNDAGVLTQISNANAAIAALSASPYVTTLNTAWVAIATPLNKEVGYQSAAGVDYFLLLTTDNSSIYAFAQSLQQICRDDVTGGAWDYISSVVNTSTLTGQAIVGSIRASNNIDRLGAVGIQARSAVAIPVGSVPAGDFIEIPPDPALYNT